jgi:alanine transaminase
MMVDLMVNPPVRDVAPETKKEFEKEKSDLLASLKKRAKIVTESLNKMKNINCQEVEGAMYAFPSVKLSDKVIKGNNCNNLASNNKPDLFYCMEVLKNTGIVLVPGSGFKQRDGTHHFRITTLIRPEEKLAEKMKVLHEFNDKFHKKYE